MGRRAIAITLAASALFAVVALHEAWTTSPTYDEPTYLVAGLTALTRHDLRINTVHPPLAKIIAATPVLLLHPTIPSGTGWRRADEHRLAADFVRAQARRGQLRRTFFVARLAPILEAIAAAWVMVLLAGRLFGPRRAWLPAILWLLNPFVIGLAAVDGIDLPFTLAALLACLAVVHARRMPAARWVVLAGACGGIAVLTRITGLLVLAALLPALAFTPHGRGPRRALVALAAAWLTIAGAYAIVAPAAILSHRAGWVAAPATLAHLAVPHAWLTGALRLQRIGSRAGPAFVLARFHQGRWLWFWPVSMVVKLPPATLAVLLAAPMAWRRCFRAASREALLVLGAPGVALLLFTLQQQRPIGLRYALAPMALWMVAATPTFARWQGRWSSTALAVVGIGGVLTMFATPSLAWSDPALGPGYRVAADSNLDWGQGYLALRDWAPGHHPLIDYFGGAGLDPASIPGARDLTDAREPVVGWVAVSASSLTVYHHDQLGWLRRYCPVDVLARTILVYRFTTPVSRSGTGPDAPPRPCRNRRDRASRGGGTHSSAPARTPAAPQGPRPSTPVRAARSDERSASG